jgi:cytidylate kinase
MKNLVIAIDGPAGSGKSTVAKALAEKLGFMYVDTGAMYRALTFNAIRKNIPLTDVDRLVDMSKNAVMSFRIVKGKNRIFLNGEDVSDFIRTEEISKLTHHIASILTIREILWRLQRELRKDHNIVMEGRDIGSKVFPDAQIKIFLDASIKERAIRRYKQLKEMGIEGDINCIETDIRQRDKNDEERDIAPLVKLPDSHIVDTTGMEATQVADKIVSMIQKMSIIPMPRAV